MSLKRTLLLLKTVRETKIQQTLTPDEFLGETKGFSSLYRDLLFSSNVELYKRHNFY